MRILLYLGTIGLLLGEVKLKRNNLKLSFTCIEETFLIFKKSDIEGSFSRKFVTGVHPTEVS